MAKNVKVVILGIDNEFQDNVDIACELGKIGEKLGYQFIITNTTNIKSINKDDLIKSLKDL